MRTKYGLKDLPEKWSGWINCLRMRHPIPGRIAYAGRSYLERKRRRMKYEFALSSDFTLYRWWRIDGRIGGAEDPTVYSRVRHGCRDFRSCIFQESEICRKEGDLMNEVNESPLGVIILAVVLVLIQGTWLFLDARKRGLARWLGFGDMGVYDNADASCSFTGYSSSTKMTASLKFLHYIRNMGIIMEINWGLIWPILALQAILAVTGLISLFRAEPANIRGPRWVWVLIILLGNLLGGVAYFVAGRREA